MNISIVKGSLTDIGDCEEALMQSELGRKYFAAENSARKALEEGFEKGEVYVAKAENNQCVGFMWYLLKGAFHSFPDLHILAIKEQYRSQGIGKRMLEEFENVGMKDSSKAFLVVADFNPKAKRLYEREGYIQVGELPSLYREGITEYLMMKTKT